VVARTAPPLVGTEDELVWGFLDLCRDTLVLKTDGLDAVQLGTRLAPSTMTLGGMLSHMAFVEDWWFSVRLHGNEASPPWAGVDWEADWDWDWHTAVDRSPDELRSMLAEAVARSREHVAGMSLDAVAATRTRSGEPYTLRWTVLHMIEEYARHNGHADLLRESIDGSTGD
jgi:uncharacterized damage-inducible protein DinB